MILVVLVYPLFPEKYFATRNPITIPKRMRYAFIFCINYSEYLKTFNYRKSIVSCESTRCTCEFCSQVRKTRKSFA